MFKYPLTSKVGAFIVENQSGKLTYGNELLGIEKRTQFIFTATDYTEHRGEHGVHRPLTSYVFLFIQFKANKNMALIC